MTDFDPPKPKLRWYQFSLRTLLTVTLVLSVFFGWVGWRIQRAKKNRELRDEIQSWGWSDYPTFERPFWLQDLFHDPGVVLAVAGYSEVGDSELMRLKEMTGLKLLRLSDTQITDAGLEHLNGLADLQILDLAGTQVGDTGLEHLEGLPKLSQLDLSGTRVTDVGLEHLKEIANLRWLYLDGTKVSRGSRRHCRTGRFLTDRCTPPPAIESGILAGRVSINPFLPAHPQLSSTAIVSDWGVAMSRMK